ncbi:MAG: TolC family protein [Pseudomonadota bacterium]
MGRPPSEILRNRSADDQPVPPEVPAGLPAALLERRPDVRKAEMDLWSATARIGEAKAALYPTIKLTGSYGLASTDLTELVNPASQSWNIFASLLQPIFAAAHFGARWKSASRSNVRQSTRTKRRSCKHCVRWKMRWLACAKLGQQRDEQRQRATAEGQVVELAELRYRGGVTDYLEVLDAQRSQFNAQIDDATTASEHTRSLIQLYKALGAGWPVPKEKTAPAADSDSKSPAKASSG